MERKCNFTGNNQIILVLILIFQGAFFLNATTFYQQNDEKNYTEYKGKVVDSQNHDGIPSAYLSVDGTNISTITNSEGEFSLKVPDNSMETTVTISSLRYINKKLALSYFKEENTVIELVQSAEELSEVSLFNATDAKALIDEVLEKRGENYFNNPTEMTAFYREAIKRGKRNVSLSEAVVTIYKKPYESWAKDDISIVKARKSADYERLDTLALKLRGGPFNTLHLDLIKNPQFLISRESLDSYEFNFDDPTYLDNRYLYVVDFKEFNRSEPWYFGKLFVDAETLTLVKATFSLNVDDRKIASDMFVMRKPGGTKVFPDAVHYEIDYREQDGKWYYGYGRADLEFIVNWKRRLFNSRYTVRSEMAITDWKVSTNEKIKKDSTFINDRVVMADDVSGFADMAFWGDNNIIEPDKSIENAIEKIQLQLTRN